MEENRRFSWSSLFIKVIIVIIFVLFTIWLLSLSHKGLSNSLDVLTNNIFSQNMEKMKEVGKEYFTTERLPKKTGEVETLTLEDMYEKNLILELIDKNGNACSAKNSYVSVEKYDDEYQMKVYLECGEEKDHIIVIMGCYNYCDTDICEKEEVTDTKYQYVKTTGGYWTEYGTWSEWSKVAVTDTNFRQVDKKLGEEEILVDTPVSKIVYAEREASCPEGYEKTEDGTKCYKNVTSTDTKDPVCSEMSGWTLVRDGFTCNYSKVVVETDTGKANCLEGYTNVNGTCSQTMIKTIEKTASCPYGYKKSGDTCVSTIVITKDPICSEMSGWTVVRNGFTCNYIKNTNEKIDPICPTVAGYTMVSRNGFTCNYKKYVKGDYVTTETGDTVPGNTSSYIYEEVGSAEYIYDCVKGCAFRWVHTWKVYKAKVEVITKTASCPEGYNKSNGTCVKTTKATKKGIASCPTGYEKSGNSCISTRVTMKDPVCPTKEGYTYKGQHGFTCIYSQITNDIKDPVCPVKTGWTVVRDGFTCNYSKSIPKTDEKDAVCPEGYTKSGNTCSMKVTNPEYEDLIISCSEGYKLTSDGTKCYKTVESTDKVPTLTPITYYRYRVREYVGGTTDYKWSSSKEDKKLLNAGYVLVSNN